MLVLLLKFVYVILLSFTYGWGLFYRRNTDTPSFALVALSGLMVINVLAGYLSLFLPMGAMANAGILAGGLLLAVLQQRSILPAIFLYYWQVKSTPAWTKLFFFIAVLFVLYISSQESFTYDEGLYYSQFIKWTQHYPVVPGLANLHTRLGFNSEWHVLAALFNGAFIFGSAVNQLNGVLYILVLLYLLKPATGAISRPLKLGLLVMIHMPWLGVYYFVSPAADLVVFYVLCMIAVVWLEQLEHGQSPHGVFLWLAPVYLVTVKLSAAPVLMISVLLAIRALQRGHYRTLCGVLGVGLVTMAPWLVRNVMLSGYLLFPFEKIDLFTTDWKVPLARVRQTREIIEAYGYLRDKIPASAAPTWLDKLVFLFQHNIRGYDLLILLLALLSPVVIWWRRNVLPAGFLPFYAFLLLGVIFWFVQAPDPRFGYGYLATLMVLSVGLAFRNIPWRGALIAAIVFQLITVGLQQHLKHTFLHNGLIVASPQQTYWWMPQPYTLQPLTYHANPFPHYTPAQRDLCWDAPLPCADHQPAAVEMRGKELQSGFKSRDTTQAIH